jgi:excisionase family DNA binding protein
MMIINTKEYFKKTRNKAEAIAFHALECMTTHDVATELGITIRTVQLWVEQGVFDAWKTPGGHRRITRESFTKVALRRSNYGKSHANNARLKVVIVEDNAEILTLYRMTIECWKLPIDVMYIANGWAGIVGIAQSNPDLLITDLKMPELDGFAVIKAIRGLPEFAHMSIIVVSGMQNSEILDTGSIPNDVSIYCKNPIPFIEIKAFIQDKLNRKLALVNAYS